MFFYQRKYKEVRVKKIKIRDEWGRIVEHELCLTSSLDLKELADELKTTQATVERCLL